MIIYHTCASRPDMERAKNAAPSFEHGYGWIPERISKFDEPYFLDNGVFSDQWAPETFIGRLDWLDQMPRDPDFVVVPDVYMDGGPSLVRSGRWSGIVHSFGYDYYLPVQDGMNVESGVRAAKDIGASGIFIGGSHQFKKEYAGQFVMTAHDYGLKAHIGKPGSRLTWARDLGADSVDTASIVRNGYFHRLRKLEGSNRTVEKTLQEAAQ